MAQVNGATFTKMDADAQTYAGVMMVNSIVIRAGAAASAMTLSADGAIFLGAFDMANDSLTVISFATPQKMTDVTATTIGTGNEVTFHFM